MARKPRVDVAGAVHHVMVRGWRRGTLFHSDEDRAAYVERVGEVLEWGGAVCYAWAVMPNHVHLVLLRGATPLAKVMQRINTWLASYVKRRRRVRSGVLDGRYKSLVVDSDAYLAELVRYVHLNPVKAGLVAADDLDDHPWTGHAALMGHAAPRLVDVDTVLGHFGATVGAARQALERWMADGVANGCAPDLVARLEGKRPPPDAAPSDRRVLGAPAFVADVLKKADDTDRERARLQADGWTVERLVAACVELTGADADEVHGGRRRRPASRTRALVSWLALEKLGATAASVAPVVGVTPVAVAKAALAGAEIAKAYGVRTLDDLPAPTSKPPADPRKPVTLPALTRFAARALDVPPAALTNRGGPRPVARARALVAYAAVADHGFAPKDVAAHLSLSRSGLAVASARGAEDAEGLARLRGLVEKRKK